MYGCCLNWLYFENEKEAFEKTSGMAGTDASPVAIPEIIAGRISAPVPFSYLKWRFPRRSQAVPDEILERKSLSSLLCNQPCFFTVCLQQ